MDNFDIRAWVLIGSLENLLGSIEVNDEKMQKAVDDAHEELKELLRDLENSVRRD